MDGPRVTALDLQRYLDQIVRISTETDNKLRAEAEAELLTKTDSAGFIELLKSLFSDEHASKIPQGIKSVTGALFKNFVKRNIKQFKYEHLEYLFQSVSLIVFSPNCSPDVCNALSESLEVAINRCEGTKVMTENLQTLLANIVFGRVLGPNLAALTKQDIIGGCALLVSLFRTLMSAVAVQHMVKNHTASILSLGWNLLQHVSERSPQPSDKILGSVAIRYFTKMLNEYFKQLVQVEAWEYFEKLLQGESGSLVDLMARILLEPASENSPCIFYPFGIEDIESNMNKSKATLIHIFQHFTNLTFSMQVFKRDPKNFAFYERWMSMTMRIIESTHLLGKRIPKEESCQGCLVAATNYMINICDSNEFYVIYQKSHRALIVDFILPHLVLTDREREDFERNEVEFCSYALDLVDSRQRNTETPKVRVAKLLDKLCIRIDGCLTFLIQTVFGLVDVVSQGLDLSAALSAHPILADVLGSEMFKKVGKMDILDMCLLTLAIVSNQILERADLKPIFLEFIRKYLKDFLVGPPIIKCRFYLLVSQHLAELAACGLQKEHIDWIITDMLAILSQQEQGSNTLVYQVIHELKTIIRLEKLEENFRLQILNLIVPQITKNTYEIFSELVNETMQDSFFQVMVKYPDALSVLVQALSERIQIEAHKNIRHSKRVILHNLLKALLSVVQEESICTVYGSTIDCQLTGLYQLLEARLIPEYDQEILSLMKSFVICSKQTGMNLYQAIIYLSEVVGDMPTSTVSISELVNVALQYGSNLFVTHEMKVTDEETNERLTLTDDRNLPNFTKELSTLGYAMVSAAHKWQIDPKSSYGNDGIVSASNVCQLVIQYLHKGFEAYPRQPENGCSLPLSNILSATVTLAELLISQQNSSYLMSKVFGVICSALIFLPNQTIGFINSVGNFSSLMKTMVSCRNVFLTQYDRRLLSLALLSIFRLKVQQEEIDEDALKWFETTILILHVQRLEEEIKGLKAASLHTRDKRKKLFKETRSEEEKRDFTLYKMIIGRGIDLDKLLEDDEPSPNNNDADDILHDMINYLDSAKLSAQKSVHKLQSPLNKVDEFIEFQKIFSDFKLLLGVRLEPQVLERISTIARECLVGVLKSHKLTFGANNQQTIEGVPTLADQPNAPRKIAKLKERNTQTQTGQFQVQGGGMIPPHLN